MVVNETDGIRWLCFVRWELKGNTCVQDLLHFDVSSSRVGLQILVCQKTVMFPVLQRLYYLISEYSQDPL